MDQSPLPDQALFGHSALAHQDFMPGSGTAVKVDGGSRVTARKAFGSGSPRA
jgi:hypothetical protein